MWSYILHNTLCLACVSSHHIAQPMTQEVQLVLPICTWVWCHSVEHGNPSSDHISKGELFFPKGTTPCSQHFSKEWGWCFSTQSMLRFWFLCRIYASNHSCCEFTPAAPQTSFRGTPLPSMSLARQSFLPSLLQHSVRLPWSRVGCFTGPLVKNFFSLDFYEVVSPGCHHPSANWGRVCLPAYSWIYQR